ncbi:DNA cytosine methyltransferase [Nocardia brasiliensis]|uniref:DNA cytosine methyltransferase n=1 Tax=Nocardia brasiliensis TaxID=37326 RepID=UPI0024543313|nr:DNA cytosine methyltransferase [Nocardia brasiliensis]
MKIGSLFSGAGGLDLAALELFPGASTAWHCENDPAASRVLAHHWPETLNLGDVTEIDWAAAEPVDVIIGGFPCQDVSAAGRRAGLSDGTRSGLWSHMADAIAALRPRFVLIENVRGLLSAKAAVRRVESGTDDLGDNSSRPVLRALGAVLGDLADLGFDAEWTCVRASQIGACHRRERVFVLAYPADAPGGRPQIGDGLAGGTSARREGERVTRRGGRRGAATDVDLAGTQGPGESAEPVESPAGGQRHVAGRDSASAVGLLPTPSVADGTGGHKTRSGSRSGELLLGGVAAAYGTGELMPTPRASDGAKGGPNQRGSSGDLMLPSAAVRWGQFADAIRRQESLSRPAPSPVEAAPRGGTRLAPEFAEWMMMWPHGWVTSPEIGLSRLEQLRVIGNGVCPPQAVAGFRYLSAMGGVLECP